MYFLGRANRFAAEQKGIARVKFELGQAGGAFRGEENQPAIFSGRRGLKRLPARMDGYIRLRRIIEGRPLQRLVAQDKAAWLNDFQRRGETSRCSDNRPHIWGDVGLIQGKAQFKGSRGQG